MKKVDLIRNFAIIAHVDHGKSTLADRILEITGTIPAREMREQFLDSMDLERERGITIKLKAVRMNYQSRSCLYQLNMIDTPGHVDFGYEVSRSLAACEGAILVVDASQGIQAQTVSNVYKAFENGLTIIPFINKIDLPVANVSETSAQLAKTFGFKKEEIICGSAKQGLGVGDLIETVIKRIPPPQSSKNAPLRALIFDSVYDEYKGVIAYIRLVDGSLSSSVINSSKNKLLFLATAAISKPSEIGVFKPQMTPIETLDVGEVGYVATGLKEIRQVRVGDTITDGSLFASSNHDGALESVMPLPGYREPKPMVFLGLYPIEGTNFSQLRYSLEKLRLSDSSLSYEPEGGGPLGMGFRCGFLGLLHADIVQERLERDYHLNLISTTPSVSYEIVLTNGSTITLRRPSDLPDFSEIREILEPYVRLYIFTPDEFSGSVLKLGESYRVQYLNLEYLGKIVKITFEAPLSEIITDFYDRLKSISSGFASLDYDLIGYRSGDLCRMDVIVAGERIGPLSRIVSRNQAYDLGRNLLTNLKETIAKHQFAVVLQAAIGGKIISREEIPAMRKNVLAKMSGGHRERKDKLLDRQREGKRRLKKLGRVEIPQEAFRAVLERK